MLDYVITNNQTDSLYNYSGSPEIAFLRRVPYTVKLSYGNDHFLAVVPLIIS